MIDITEKQLAEVQSILKQYFPGVKVWAFGSRVTGQAKKYSDLDLVLVGQEKTPLKKYYQLQDAFEESLLPYRVDVVDWHRISPEFQKIIKANYEVIFCGFTST